MDKGHFLFFLVFIYINNDGTFVRGLCQPPVEEGFPYTMNCFYPLSKVLQFHWKVTSDLQGSSSRFYTCELHGKRSCYQSPNHKFNVTVTSNTTHFKSSLKIPNITTQDRDAEFQCDIWEKSINKLVTLKTCQVKSYHAPETLTCQSVRLDKGGALQKCHTSRVYPGILCSLYRAVDGEFEKVPTTMTYNYNMIANSSSQKAVYYSASCFFTYPKDTTDKDFFQVKMFASVGGNAIPGSEKIVSINTPTTGSKLIDTISRSVKILPTVKSKESTHLPITMTPKENGTRGRHIGEIIGENFLIAVVSVIGLVISLVFICLFILCYKISENVKRRKSEEGTNKLIHNTTNVNKDHC